MNFKMAQALPLPQLASIKGAVQLLALDAACDAEPSGNPNSLEDLDACFRLSKSLADEPFLISLLTRFSCESLIISSLEYVLNRQSLTDKQLQHLSREFQYQENPHGLEHALAGELCMGATIFRVFPEVPNGSSNYDRSGDDEYPSEQQAQRRSQARVFLKLTGFTTRDFGYFLEAMHEHLEISKLTYPQALDREAMEDKRLNDELSFRHFYILSSLLLPAQSKAGVRACGMTARFNIVQTVLAIERFRLANQDRIPEKLNELVPAFLASVPMDPFDGQPLRFKKLNPGYLVYSVGPDRKDDGGIEPTGYNLNARGDIPFTVRRHPLDQ